MVDMCSGSLVGLSGTLMKVSLFWQIVNHSGSCFLDARRSLLLWILNLLLYFGVYELMNLTIGSLILMLC